MKEEFNITLRVRQKKDKKWMWELELPPIDEKRNRKTKCGFKTKKAALADGESVKQEYEANPSMFKKSKMTMRQLLDIWYEEYCLVNLAESSYTGYKKKFKRINNSLGDIEVVKLETSDVQKFINDLARENFSINSLPCYKGILTNSLDYAIRIQKVISTNPAKAVKTPRKGGELAKRANKHPHRFIEDDEIAKILERFPEGTSTHIPLIMCIRAGLRRGEAFGVDWSEINLRTKTIEIKHQLQYNESRKAWCLIEPKYNSVRKFKLDDKTIELLKREKKRQKENKKEYGDRYVEYFVDENGVINNESGTPIEFINVEPNGEMITSNRAQYTSEVIREQLHIEGFTFHSLRHTNTTKLIENGATPKAVQMRLGHKNIEETMDIYAHCSNKMSDNATKIANAIY
ncbi:MAG: site-specific integrase [Eubacterium sp.]|nr:site-specific integrase [Eubacterium sp.]